MSLSSGKSKSKSLSISADIISSQSTSRVDVCDSSSDAISKFSEPSSPLPVVSASSASTPSKSIKKKALPTNSGILLTGLLSATGLTANIAIPSSGLYTQQYSSRLLLVLETMTLLRSRSSPQAAEEGEIASRIICNEVRFNNCWDMLFECLDYVREMEGLTFETEEDTFDQTETTAATDSNATTVGTVTGGLRNRHGGRHSLSTASAARHISSSSTSPRGAAGSATVSRRSSTSIGQPTSNLHEHRPLSSLTSITMRFIPLIETFLLVCGAAILRRNTIKSSSTSINTSSANAASICK